MGIIKTIGKKIIAVKGFNTKKKVPTRVEAEYILFDDKKTYIFLEEQDYYSYHDCSLDARHVLVYEDAKMWVNIMNNPHSYPDANAEMP